MRKVSNVFVIIIAFLLLCIIPASVIATVRIEKHNIKSGTRISHDEIKKLIPQMKRWVRDDGLNEKAVSDSSFDHAICIFTNFNPDSISDNSLESIEDYINTCEHIWEIPVDISGETYIFTVGEQISEKHDNKKTDRNLHIYSFGKGIDVYECLITMKRKYGYDECFIVSGLPGDTDKYILTIKNRKAKSFIPITESKSIVEISWNDMKSLVKNMESVTTKDGMRGLPELSPDKNSSGKEANWHNYIIVLFIIIAVVMGYLLIINVTKKN